MFSVLLGYVPEHELLESFRKSALAFWGTASVFQNGTSLSIPISWVWGFQSLSVFGPCYYLFFLCCFLSKYEVGVVLISVSLIMLPMALNTLKICLMVICIFLEEFLVTSFSFGVLGIEPKAWHTPSKGSITSHTSNSTSSSFFLLSPFLSLFLLLHRDST